MKRLILIAAALLSAVQTPTARPTDETLAEIYAAIGASETEIITVQSLDELNAAARKRVIEALRLTEEQLRRFEPLYDAYRAELRKVVLPEPANETSATTAEILQVRLDNIANTSQVKRDYIEKFATILDSEQIRTLYNTEGRIASEAKSRRTQRADRGKPLSNEPVVREFACAADFHTLSVGNYVRVKENPAIDRIRVTATERAYQIFACTCEGGVLSLNLNIPKVNRNGAYKNYDLNVQVEIPVSSRLATLRSGQFASIECARALVADNIDIGAGQFSEVKAAVGARSNAVIAIDSYAKYHGTVKSQTVVIDMDQFSAMSGDVECRGTASVSVEQYAGHKGAINADHLTYVQGSYSSHNGAITARQANITLHNYAQFTGGINSRSVEMLLGSFTAVKSSVTVQTPLSVTVGPYANMAGNLSSPDRITLATGQFAQYSGTLDAPEVEIRTSGYGKMTAKVEADDLTITQGSYSNVRLQGERELKSARAAVKGWATLDARELAVRDFELQAGNYSQSSVNCTSEFDLQQAGSDTKIHLYGNCKVAPKQPKQIIRK